MELFWKTLASALVSSILVLILERQVSVVLAGRNYVGGVVGFNAADAGGFLSAAALAGKDNMQIAVAGNEERMLLLAVYDNLGKGASGAAVECMNLVTGAEKTLGLEL